MDTLLELCAVCSVSHLGIEISNDGVPTSGGAFWGDILVSWDTPTRHSPRKVRVAGTSHGRKGRKSKGEGGHVHDGADKRVLVVSKRK